MTASAALVLALSACAAQGPLPEPPDDRSAVLVGSLGPGRPAGGRPPERVGLVFSGRGDAVRTAVARDGEYRVVLPAGAWDVRAVDGHACALGLVVHGGSSHRVDLPYPSATCLPPAPPGAPGVPPPPAPR